MRLRFKREERLVRVMLNLRRLREIENFLVTQPVSIETLREIARVKHSIEVMLHEYGRTPRWRRSIVIAALSLTEQIERFREKLANAYNTGERLPKIHRPVGSRAHAVLIFIFPKKVFEQNFAEAIRDMREDANEADADGKYWFRRWIVFRDNATLSFSVLLYIKCSIIAKIVGAFRNP